MLAILCAFYGIRWLAGVLYALVAAMWLVPDRRIERAAARHPSRHGDD